MTDARAVICVCCARPTGEFIGGDRDATTYYCDDCRDLPTPWRVNPDETTTTTGTINRDADMRGAYHATAETQNIATGNATVIGGRRWVEPPLQTPIMDDPDDDEDDEPDTRPCCPRCGGTAFRIEMYAAGRIYHGGDTADNEPGERTLWHEYQEDDTYGDEIVAVRCDNYRCGAEWPDHVYDNIEHV